MQTVGGNYKKRNQMFEKIRRFFNKENSNSTENNSDSDKVPFEIRIKKIESYFKIHSETDEAFKLEYVAAKRINEIILKEETSEKDILEIVRIFNETNSKPHYDGSGWMDFSLHLQGFIRKNGMGSKVLSNKNIELTKSERNLPTETNLYGVVRFKSLTKEKLANEFRHRNWKIRKVKLVRL